MKTFQTISPIDNSIFLEREIANAKTIEATLALSKTAQKKWRQTSFAERAAICQKVVAYFVQNAQEIGEELTWQMGRPIRYTPFELSKGFKERAEYMIEIAATTLADVYIPQKAGFQRFIQRDPLGMILVLAPWNYPYLTSVNAIIPCYHGGQFGDFKTRQTKAHFAQNAMAKAFEQAGLPQGVFQYLHLEHRQVAKIIKDRRIDFVAFTGSIDGGAAVQKAMSRRFINAGLELGGKDPAYVRADVNLEHAIENLVDGAFFNSGQSCCGVERIYVHESLFKNFVDGFVALSKQYVLGNPLEKETTLGPMVRTSAASFAQNQIKRAVKKGATTLIDPKDFAAHQTGTPYMAPQVLINVNHSMKVMTEESFAPLVGIMPVKDDDEAIQLMNDSQYGLTASIWTQDIDQAIEIGNQVETGTFFMNRCDYLDPALAWTGVKNSGRGCTLSALGYEVLTRPKSFHLRRLEAF